MNEEKSKIESEKLKGQNEHFPEDPGFNPGHTPQAKTKNDKPETENMEVHHHSHTHGKKNWKAYFWEFLMLFLAVFCGFLAEYKLEHVIEHQREKTYIRSMIEDLKNDTTNFSITINNFIQNESHLENVLHDFEEGRKNNTGNWAQEFIFTARMGFTDFYYTDRTLQQLKNSGGMRLIRNEKVASGIIKYDTGIKDLETETDALSETMGAYMETVDKVWSFSKLFKDQGVIKWQRDPVLPVTKNYWATDKPSDFEYLYNKATHYYYTYFRVRKDLNMRKKEATELINLLATEYHLK